MTRFFQRWALLWLLSLAMTSVLLGSGPSQTAQLRGTPEKILKDNGFEPTAAGVEACLRSLIIDDSFKKRVSDLISQLGAEDFQDREKANAGLEDIGPRAIEALRRARKAPIPKSPGARRIFW